jgi:hypothetical protein
MEQFIKNHRVSGGPLRPGPQWTWTWIEPFAFTFTE